MVHVLMPCPSAQIDRRLNIPLNAIYVSTVIAMLVSLINIASTVSDSMKSVPWQRGRLYTSRTPKIRP